MCTNENPTRMPALPPPAAPGSLLPYPFSAIQVKQFADANNPPQAQLTAAASLPSASSGSSGPAALMPSVPNGPAGFLSHLPPAALDQYRLQLYNYAFAERLRYTHPAAFLAGNPYIPPGHPLQLGRPPDQLTPFFLQYGKFDPRFYRPQEEPKPQYSYIGLIAMAILSSADKKLVLSDIYQYILDNYPYFRTRGPGWRNSIRHNLSLNDCFIKAGRSANGKGHYWAIHPANVEDFKKGDFRRRKAQRKVRKHMGLAVDEEDSPSPPSSPVMGAAPWVTELQHHQRMVANEMTRHHGGADPPIPLLLMTSQAPVVVPRVTSLSPSASSEEGQPRKRLFDMASLLGRNDDNLSPASTSHRDPEVSREEEEGSIDSESKRVKIEFDEEVDVVSEEHDSEEEEADNQQQAQPEAIRAPQCNEAAHEVKSSLPAAAPAAGPLTINPAAPPTVFAPANAAADLWRTSLAPNRQQLPPNRMVQYLNTLAAVHPHHPATAATFLNPAMEQLTKYYEQVAEAMRLSGGAKPGP